MWTHFSDELLRASRWVAAISLALAVGSGAAQAAAVSPDELRAERIARNTMSPFCPHLTLSACPTEQAAEWRRDVRLWAFDGVSTEEIMRRLQARAPDVDLGGELQGAGPLPVLVGLGVLALGAPIAWRWRNSKRSSGRSTAVTFRRT